jgi:hypothetical protein
MSECWPPPLLPGSTPVRTFVSNTKGGALMKLEIRKVENTRLTKYIPDYDS